MRTFSAKPSDVARSWHLIDASEAPVGRIATTTAELLLGKPKPSFTKHIDTGDYVVIINADNLIMTGNKSENKKYYKHSGFPGGLKETKLRQQIEKDSTYVLYNAVRGMLPVNKLRAGRLARLKIYAGAEHSHDAQQPIKYKLEDRK